MIASGPAPVRFYFDFISPFGYFASLRIDALAARYGRQVEWTSMLLGISVLKVMKIPAIVDLPLKGAYVIRDAKRYARQNGVEFRRPEAAPASRPVEAGRLFAWAKACDPARSKHVAAAIYRSYFVDGRDIAEPAVLRECCVGAGLDWKAYEAARESGEAAQLLRRNVDESIAAGVFGSPFFIVDGEPFFGAEKLPVVEEWIASGGW